MRAREKERERKNVSVARAKSFNFKKHISLSKKILSLTKANTVSK